MKFNNSDNYSFLKDACNWDRLNNIVITCDIDWAPDFIIKYFLESINSKISIFITNNSPQQKLLSNSKLEVGYHPNLHKNSTQGKNLKECMIYLNKISKKKLKFNRFHLLNYTYNDLKELKNYGVKVDSSVLLFNTSYIQPIEFKNYKLIQIPYFWEDGTAINNNLIGNNKKINLKSKGCKIFNFHPIDFYFNIFNLKHKHSIMQHFKDHKFITRNKSKDFINYKYYGVRNFYEDLIKYCSTNKIKISTLGSLYKSYKYYLSK